MDNRKCVNDHDIRAKLKLHKESYGKLERRTNPRTGKNLRRYLPERLVIDTIIYYGHDATY